MFGHATYLIWLALFIGVPLLILLRWRRPIWAQRRALGWTLVGSLVGGWVWDALAVRYDLWYYDEGHLAGPWFLGLPLEEWLWITGVTLMFGGLTVVLKERSLRRARDTVQTASKRPIVACSLLPLAAVALTTAPALLGLPLPLHNLFMLAVAGVVFHTILWSLNGRFLWQNRGVILGVLAFAELWMLITDPIGGHWGAWYFTRDRVLGIWFLEVMPIEDFFGIAVVSTAAACAVLVFGYSKKRWIW